MIADVSTRTEIPFFRPSITDEEIEEVVACLKSGWLTTGPRVKEFEDQFAAEVGAKNAVAVNSATAALHLGVEALGLKQGDAVLVPTMTFAATAEVVHYQGAIPILVDCDPVTLNMDLADAEQKLDDLRTNRSFLPTGTNVVGMIPVHVGGLMMDVGAIQAFAKRHGLWVVEDAAHAFPAAYCSGPGRRWQWCGENTSAVTCFSFYANKTITTGEGGMAVTDNPDVARQMRQLSLHGLSRDAWDRRNGHISCGWDYRVVTPGHKYNLTDIAAAIGIHQVRRSEQLRRQRQTLARRYLAELTDLEQLELPPAPPDRLHAWHLFPVRLHLNRLSIDRNAFFDALRESGIGCSVHYRPLHLHPYYKQTFGWKAKHFPIASRVWKRLISLPLFPDMDQEEQTHVIQVVRDLCHRYAVNGNGTTNGRRQPD